MKLINLILTDLQNDEEINNFLCPKTYLDEILANHNYSVNIENRDKIIIQFYEALKNQAIYNNPSFDDLTKDWLSIKLNKFFNSVC